MCPAPRPCRTALWSAIACAALLPGLGRAQNAMPFHEETTSSASKQIVAVRTGGLGLEIDGRLHDEAWEGAQFASDFRQKEPVRGAEPSERTEVAFLYDDHALYVGARMYADDPTAIVRSLSRRDAQDNSERLVISLDTFRDRRTAYAFAVNPAGVRADWYHPEDSPFSTDPTFDPVWEAHALVDSLGWTAEMRIPFSQLRFNGAATPVWGVNVHRMIPARNEEVYWVMVPREETGWASRFGDLVGLEEIRSPSRLEVMPYVASDATFAGAGLVDTSNPFDDGWSMATRAGADIKMGLGPNLTLDATVNPDFGQVDADPAEVNLTAFETFFDERRPFFTEGSQLLEGGGPGYFYSRRIGGAPKGEADGDYVDAPARTTILGAAKLTGRLPSGLSVGALAAVTANEYARTFDSTTKAFDEVRVAPWSGYAAARVQQELGASASTVGLSLTNVHRDLHADGSLREHLTRNAVAGGADWNLRFRGGAYQLTGHVGGSYVEGDTAAIARLQEGSAHYFQRPDQSHVTFDPSRTALAGWTAALGARKRSGSVLFDVSANATSPGFETNDAGRLRRADEITASANLWYRETDPGVLFRQYAFGAWSWNLWNTGGIARHREAGVWGNATFHNYMGGWISFLKATGSRDDELTRGGPLVGIGDWWRVNGGIWTNPGAAASFYANAAIFNNPRSDWEGWETDGGLIFRPSGPWGLSANFNVSHTTQGREYVDTVDGGPASTYGRRYVLSPVRGNTYALQLRASYSFTPDLSLELYAEPFVASRRFTRLGEVPAPEALELREYGTDGSTLTREPDGSYTVTDGGDTFAIANPDVDVRSFRSNVVLRWEWHPGSTLFLVWQQDRSSDDLLQHQARPGDLFDTLRAPGQNFVAIKASYWLAL